MDRELIPFKAYYFTVLAAQGALLPFLPVLANDVGLTKSEISVIFGIFPMIIILTNPSLGILADYYAVHKLMFIILAILEIIFTFPLYFLNKEPTNYKEVTESRCNSSGLFAYGIFSTDAGCYASSYDKIPTLTCQHHCNVLGSLRTQFLEKMFNGTIPSRKEIVLNYKIRNDSIHSTTDPEQVNVLAVNEIELANPNEGFQCSSDLTLDCRKSDFPQILFTMSSVFFIFLFLKIFAEIANSSGISLADMLTLEKLGDKEHLYGRQRVFGSVGYGAAGGLLGYVGYATAESTGQNNYLPAFITYVVFYIIAIIIIIVVMNVIVRPGSRQFLTDLGKLLTIPQLLVFMVIVFIDGMFHRFLFTFLYIYLKELGGTQLHQGLALLFSTLGEIPIFIVSGIIIEKIGIVFSMVIVFGFWAFRMFMYTVLENPWFFLPVELSHGITFSLFYATMTTFAKLAAPPGTLATAQVILFAMFQGFGGGFGALLGGFCYDNFGIIVTLRVASLLAVIVGIIYGIVGRVLMRPLQVERKVSPIDRTSPTRTSPTRTSPTRTPPTSPTSSK